MAANPGLADANRIYVGQELTLPRGVQPVGTTHQVRLAEFAEMQGGIPFMPSPPRPDMAELTQQSGVTQPNALDGTGAPHSDQQATATPANKEPGLAPAQSQALEDGAAVIDGVVTPAPREHLSLYQADLRLQQRGLEYQRAQMADQPALANLDEENEDGGQRYANEIDGIGPSGARMPKTDATDIVGIAGYAAAGGSAGIDGAGRQIDYAARAAAAEILTRGNAGNLPVPRSEYANRTELGKGITDPRITVDDALGKTPYGPDAQSTRQLNAAARTTSALNAAAKTIGLGLQPTVGALQGYRNTPEDAGFAQTGLNMARAAVKEVDDTLVSYVFGSVAAGGVVALSPSTGPAAPAVAIVGAPAAGMAIGIAAGAFYNEALPDKAFDKGVDFAFDGIESVVDTFGDAFGYVGNQIDQWEAGIIEQAVRRTARGAND